MVNDLLFTSMPVPDDVQKKIQGAEGGIPFWIPTSITLSSGSVMLPPDASGSLGVRLSGRVDAKYFGFSGSNTLTLAMMVGMSPSADPVDRSRVLAVTAGSNPSLAVSRVPGWLSKLLAPWVASAVASLLEGLVNQVIASKVSDELAHPPGGLFAPSMLTQTAVLSMGRIQVLTAGIDLAVAIGDIFGPGIIPIAGNMTAVPYVINKDVTSAANAIGTAGLIFEGQDDGKSLRYDVPTVIKTTPPAHTQVQKGTYVTCLIVYPDNSR